MTKKLAAALEQPDVQSELLFHNGVFAYNAGDSETAIQFFEESLKLCPLNENAKSALARVKGAST